MSAIVTPRVALRSKSYERYCPWQLIKSAMNWTLPLLGGCDASTTGVAKASKQPNSIDPNRHGHNYPGAKGTEKDSSEGFQVRSNGEVGAAQSACLSRSAPTIVRAHALTTHEWV
jgi:hypothetical protein